MGRTAERQGIELGGRMQLVESDLDAFDAGLEKVEAKLGKILWAIVGLLISVTTTSIVLLITVGAGR